MRTHLRAAVLLLALLCLGGCFPLTRGVHAMGRRQEILDPIHLFRDDAAGRYAVVLNADYLGQGAAGPEESRTKVLLVTDAAVQEGPLVSFDPSADDQPGVTLVPAAFGQGLDEAALKQMLTGCRELILRRSEDGAFLDGQRGLAVRVRVASDAEHRRDDNPWWAFLVTPLYVPAVLIDVVCLPVQAVMDE